MGADPWLEKWLPSIASLADTGPVLELGCGEGRDTRELVAAGRFVVASDVSEASLRVCSVRAPGASLVRLDHEQPLPFRSNSFPVIVASLCLHYFGWGSTRRIVAEIRRCLRSTGFLLVRLNSTNDIHHGADSTDEIERRYYRVGERQKRFFGRSDVLSLFPDAEIIFLEEVEILRFDKPKIVWEAALRPGRHGQRG